MSANANLKNAPRTVSAFGIGMLQDAAQNTDTTAVEPQRHTRPWGYYMSLDLGKRYQVKRLVVVPGGRLSLQSHVHRSEHWTVVQGTATVTVGETRKLLGENESVYIPLGAIHRLENEGRVPLVVIEVQTGSYFGEDDIVRYEDVYNRIEEKS